MNTGRELLDYLGLSISIVRAKCEENNNPMGVSLGQIVDRQCDLLATIEPAALSETSLPQQFRSAVIHRKPLTVGYLVASPSQQQYSGKGSSRGVATETKKPYPRLRWWNRRAPVFTWNHFLRVFFFVFFAQDETCFMFSFASYLINSCLVCRNVTEPSSASCVFSNTAVVDSSARSRRWAFETRNAEKLKKCRTPPPV